MTEVNFMSQNISGYLLVKDKDGQLKYFKDGRFYSLEEVKKIIEQVSISTDQIRKKMELKPVLTFEDKQKSAVSIPAAPQPATPQPVVASVPPKPIASMKLKPILMKPASTRVETQNFASPFQASPIPVAPVKSVIPPHPVDRVETQNLASPLPVAPPSVKNNFDLESLEHDVDMHSRRQQDHSLVQVRAQEVIERLKIQFTDEQIKQRFLNIVTTYFRGIRGKAEVEYILTLSRAGGGLELPKEKAEMIVAMLGQHSDETNKERRGIVSKPKNDSGLGIGNSELVKEAFAGEFPITNSQPQTQPRPMPPKQMIKPEIVKPTELAQPAVQPKVGDVKMSSKLVGPIEELTYMTIADFRLLGRNIDEIVNSLLEKIQLLSDESLGRKVQGIKAWKQSPIFLLYLGMSMQGIMQGKTMEQIIIDRQRNHEDCLTLSEFEAISRLNSQLVY